MEKPLAPGLADAVGVVERSRAVSRPVMVAENYRFYRAERTLRHMLASDAVGRVHWATCVDRRDQPSQTQGPWVKAMDHPFLTEIGVHHFDSFRYLFDRRPTSVFALSQPPGSGYEKEAAAAVIELEGGLPIQYGGTFAAARYEFALWIEGSKGISGPIGNAYGGGRAADDFFVLASQYQSLKVTNCRIPKRALFRC